MLITLAVIAKNEERAITTCLHSLLSDAVRAEADTGVRFDAVVVLDDCTDSTESIVRGFSRFRVIHSHGGIVEAQRKVANSSPFVIYSDADILLQAGTLTALVRAMQAEPELQVVYPAKAPLPLRSASPVARALHTYNRVNGFQTKRRYFNGKLFAIRDWSMPTLLELQEKLSALPPDRFYNFHAGMRVDDVYLSRDILHRHGQEAIREVDAALIRYQPPASFQGMYRTYRRMRMEIERLDIMFPETRPTHQAHGIRRYDPIALRAASRRDLADWYLFRLLLGLCILLYKLERLYYRHFSRSSFCPAWAPIVESKCLNQASSD